VAGGFRGHSAGSQSRIKLFTALPIEKLDLVALEKHLEDIGHTEPVER